LGRLANLEPGWIVSKVADPATNHLSAVPNRLNQPQGARGTARRDPYVTGELPYTVLVMISDEQAAGRIVVELDPFVEFNVEIDRQLAELEARMVRAMPQLRRRSVLSRRS